VVANPPGNINVVSGSTGVTVLQATLNNPSSAAVTLTSLTVTDTGSGNTANITSVSVLIGGVAVGSTTVFAGSSANLNLGNYVLPAFAGQSLEILVNFSGSATGTYQVSLSAMVGASGNNGGQPVSFTGLPLWDENVTVQQPTGTPTNSPTPTSTITPTISPTPVPQKYPVIYPNPVDGPGPVNVRPPTFQGVCNVKVQIFTLAFRKVQEKIYPGQVAGQDCPIQLVDDHNDQLADGLYYVVVTTSAGRSIGKMLVLR
jgi:hypothetical protein